MTRDHSLREIADALRRALKAEGRRLTLDAFCRAPQRAQDAVLRADIARLLAAGHRRDFDEGWPEHHACEYCVDWASPTWVLPSWNWRQGAWN